MRQANDAVLITGATGLVGGAVLQRMLALQGCEVEVVPEGRLALEAYRKLNAHD